MENKLDFKTIKKFTGEAKYCAYTTLDSLVETIQRYEEKYALQLNPDFQRGHVWTEDQQIRFVEYFLRGGDVQPIRFNHNDWMNFKRKDQEMVCVDGLQRLTALMKFMNNLLPVFGGYFKNDLENFTHFNFDIKISINNLKDRKEVLNWYIELNEGGTVHTKEEIDRVKSLLNT